MRRSRITWVVFVLALCVLLSALAWMTHTTLALEAARLEAAEHARLETHVRLALWRLDTAAAPLLARESVVAPLAWTSVEAGESVARRYEVAPEAGGPLVARFVGDRAALPLAAAPQQPATGGLGTTSRWGTRRDQQARATNTQQVLDTLVANALDAPEAGLVSGPLRAMWVADRLVLARRLDRPGRWVVQVAELDWNSLRRRLLAELDDLLPEARLEAAAGGDPDERLMSMLPVRLLPGALPAAAGPQRSSPGASTSLAASPLRLTLTLAWVLVLVAAGAVALLLGGALSLSERRAAFVSTVTHELRTPLTTFRMYAEMLVDRMVPPEKVPGYHETLLRESERLDRLVRNVLTYARVERGRHPDRREAHALAPLLAPFCERMASLLAPAGLVVEAAELPEVHVLADPDALEHVLLNLAENAAKYAAGAEDRRVHLEVRVEPRRVRLVLRDHGPGLPPGELGRIFEPFSKSSAHAAGTEPGIGLGLALSRRLARQMGGDLHAEPSPEGAVFVLRLRRAA